MRTDALIPRPVLFRTQLRNTIMEFADGAVVKLPVGVGDITQDVLRHEPPLPSELERAIELIEDALLASRLPKADRGALLASDDIFRTLPGLGTAPAALSIEAVEVLFQLLASRSLGKPVSAAELPRARESAAALLLLRECMHHLGFNRVETQPGFEEAAGTRTG